ncbi:aminotransferase class V-fold PLP-dependent enzyme [Candidatus Micrarchaeota archaeon]|nr:aminotransferase class V-fold PLP-dependent enzyme [Candidatus Micrarchaeota archaeon]
MSIPKDAELICFTHNETSTGVKTDFELIKQVKRENPDKLVAVDVVSSAPCVDIAFESADCVFFSVQKGFGLPAGLGVLVVSPQALEKTRQLAKNNTGATGSYHSFASLEKSGDRLETPETPNVLALHLLGVSCAELNKKGREKIICETKEKAKKLYSFFDGENKFKCFVKKENWRSDTIVVLNTPYGSAKVIADLNTKGFVVGTGYGGFKEKQVRLSNFPAHSMAQVDELIKAFE